MNIHELLAYKRKQQGLSQVQLASTLKVSQPDVSAWEKNRVPNTAYIIKLMVMYGITVQEIEAALKEVDPC